MEYHYAPQVSTSRAVMCSLLAVTAVMPACAAHMIPPWSVVVSGATYNWYALYHLLEKQQARFIPCNCWFDAMLMLLYLLFLRVGALSCIRSG
jgi:hypothetical protein